MLPRLTVITLSAAIFQMLFTAPNEAIHVKEIYSQLNEGVI